MFSGICPRGSSSAPGSGNTGMISGSSPGPRYIAFIGFVVLLIRSLFRMGEQDNSPQQNQAHGVMLAHDLVGKSVFRPGLDALGKQDRRQFAPSGDGRLVGRPPRLEELYKLLARAVLVPFAITLDDVEEMIRGFLALAVRVQRDGKIEARLMIERIGGNFLFKLA